MPDTPSSEIHAFIINLDRSPERLLHVQKQLDEAGISYTRVAAVEGSALSLPHPQYNENLYKLKHGKRTSMGELGCYFSHLKVYEQFLETDLPYVLVCEDDITIPTNTASVLAEVEGMQTPWDLVKISKINSSVPISVESLTEPYSLAINLGRHTGSGAYLINRRAAESLLRRISVMTIPFDHAFDKEWRTGIRAYSLQPSLIKQEATKFKTTINTPGSSKYPAWQRYWTVFPYRLVTEVSRVLYRSLRVLTAKINKSNR